MSMRVFTATMCLLLLLGCARVPSTDSDGSIIGEWSERRCGFIDNAPPPDTWIFRPDGSMDLALAFPLSVVRHGAFTQSGKVIEIHFAATKIKDPDGSMGSFPEATAHLTIESIGQGSPVARQRLLGPFGGDSERIVLDRKGHG